MRERTRMSRREIVAHSTWATTFCDLIFLLLAFYVLLFSMSSPRPKANAEQDSIEASSAQSFSVEAEGDTTVIVGAFHPSNSTEFSYRGKTALYSLALQAQELRKEVVVTVHQVTGSEIKNSEDLGREQIALMAQRDRVLRQLIDSGVLPENLAMSPIETEKVQRISLENRHNPLSSRIEITLQDKRN